MSIQPHTPTDTMRLVVRAMQRKKVKLKRDQCESQGSVFAGREIDLLCSSEGSDKCLANVIDSAKAFTSTSKEAIQPSHK